MRIEFRLETYLFKYYIRHWNVETTMSRTNIPAMLALAQIKHRGYRKDVNVQKLKKKIFFNTTTGIRFKNGLVRSTPRAGALTAFNLNIRGMFYSSFYEYMDDRCQNYFDVNNNDHVREFMSKYSLSDDEINEGTLTKSYYRYRSGREKEKE